ncbi:MAG: S8 family serine peptidase [Cyanobacteria bacterium P01_D01_bin.116]
MRFKKFLILCIVFLLTICLTILPVTKVAGQNIDILKQLTDSCPESEIVNDRYYCKQWNLKNTSSGIKWEALKTWETYHNYGRDIIIAVLGTGVEWHGDLDENNFVEGYDFFENERIKYAHLSVDDDGHETKMAGIIAQTTNNIYGTAGIAYQARIMPVRILEGGDDEKDKKIDLETLAKGIEFAAKNGANVINLSLGEISIPTNTDVGNLVFDTTINHLEKAINTANEKGAVVVFAAGNKKPGHKFIGYMSKILQSDKVITVAAHDINGNITDYSGKVANISAPGGSGEKAEGLKFHSLHTIKGILAMVPETILGAEAKKKSNLSVTSGSSEAAAHVSGVAAIVMSELKSCGNRYESCPKIDDAKIASVARNIIIGSALHSTTNQNDIPKLDAAQAELDAWMYIVELTESDSYDASAASSKSPSTSFLVPATNLVMQNVQAAEDSRADTIIFQNQSWIFLFTALIVLISFFLLRRFPFLLATVVYGSNSSLILMSQVENPILFYLSQALVAFIPVILITFLLQVKYWSRVAKGTAFGASLVLISLAILNFGSYQAQAIYSLICSIPPGIFFVLSVNKRYDFAELMLEIEQMIQESQVIRKNIEENLRVFFRKLK